MVNKLIEFYAPILADLCEKFPNFEKYIENPFNEIFTYFYRRNYYNTPEEERVDLDMPIDFNEDLFNEEFRDYFCSKHNGYISCGSYKVCLLIDKGLGREYVLKFSKEFEDDDENPCELEVEFFNEADREGLSRFFAETFYLGNLEINNVISTPLYAAARHDVDEDYVFSMEGSIDKDEFYTKDYNYDDFESCFSEEGVLDCFAESYSIEDIEKLIVFLDDNGICDIHGANIGFDNWKNPVIIDYSYVR